MGNELHQNQILSSITTRWLGKSYRFFPEIGSTNTEILAANRTAPLQNGTVFLTDYQSRGKGRLGRRWTAPRGSSLLLSILFQPSWPSERPAAWLVMIACLAVVEAVEVTTSVSPKIKWPNDVVVAQNGSWHKTAGILLEGVFGEDGVLETAVLGMGINVNIPQGDLPETHTPATSLMLAQGAPIDRAVLLRHLLQRLEKRYELIAAGSSPLAAWKDRLVTLGQRVAVSQVAEQARLEGVAEDVTIEGHLLVRDAKNRLHTVQAGDVTLRPFFDIYDK